MRQLTRREMLHGLGACSALALFSPLGRAAAEGLRADSAPAFTHLNVLIHGMSVIHVGDKDITLYPPIVPHSLHVYEAGSTGSEKPLVKGRTYHLIGVNSKNLRPSLVHLHPEDNGVFPRHGIVPGDYFCRIVLPFPDDIVPLRLTQVQSSEPFFQGSPAPYQQPSAIADLNVFRYTVTGPVSLKPLSWVPTAKNGIANLQIFAMPNGPVPTSHPKEAFQAAANTMGYPGLKANSHYDYTSAAPPDPHPAVPGVSVSDENGLQERAKVRSHASGNVHILANSAMDCLSLFMY
ncbi:MAG: hypothetical protein KGL59_05690 [Acidobacteriota bacterium]|nr:hypothetical protein [Acidobacteriota bacterium]